MTSLSNIVLQVHNLGVHAPASSHGAASVLVRDGLVYGRRGFASVEGIFGHVVVVAAARVVGWVDYVWDDGAAARARGGGLHEIVCVPGHERVRHGNIAEDAWLNGGRRHGRTAAAGGHRAGPSAAGRVALPAAG